MDKQTADFLEKIDNQIAPLESSLNLAYFDATISGKEENYQKVSEIELDYTKKLSDKDDFKQIKNILENSDLDKEEKRIFQLLYLEYLGNQADIQLQEKIITLQNSIEQSFNAYRVSLDGEVKTDNEIDEILKKSTDPTELEKAWMASKKIGEEVEKQVLELVKLRNIEARELGYDNYHEMSLSLHEQTSKEILTIFDELNNSTSDLFQKVKNEIDRYLCQKYNIEKNDLMPWHYQNRFFQEAPSIYSANLDSIYQNQDLVQTATDYFNSINLSIESVLENSDLFEKPNKYQHAYCIDIDRKNDVRIVCNLKPDQKWMDTLLHELGHAAYDKFIDHNLNWNLHRPTHIFITEGIALFFGKLATNAEWIKNNLGISVGENSIEQLKKQIAFDKIVFSRWAQVMFRFEMGMYENPDQNLNALWWDLVEKYQGLRRPQDWDKPYWASKIHIVSSPVYYHNYLLGDLFTSQLTDRLVQKNIKIDQNDPKLGQFLKESVFSSGASLRWDEFVEKTTGKLLDSQSFVKEYSQF